MSDYISKSATMQRFVKETEQSRRDCIHINTIKRLLDDVDTVDEKEIIRKPFERVVERLEHQKKQYNRRSLECEKNGNRFGSEKMYSKACSYNHAIEIVKEEGGLNE